MRYEIEQLFLGELYIFYHHYHDYYWLVRFFGIEPYVSACCSSIVWDRNTVIDTFFLFLFAVSLGFYVSVSVCVYFLVFGRVVNERPQAQPQ